MDLWDPYASIQGDDESFRPLDLSAPQDEHHSSHASAIPPMPAQVYPPRTNPRQRNSIDITTDSVPTIVQTGSLLPAFYTSPSRDPEPSSLPPTQRMSDSHRSNMSNDPPSHHDTSSSHQSSKVSDRMATILTQMITQQDRIVQQNTQVIQLLTTVVENTLPSPAPLPVPAPRTATDHTTSIEQAPAPAPTLEPASHHRVPPSHFRATNDISFGQTLVDDDASIAESVHSLLKQIPKHLASSKLSIPSLSITNLMNSDKTNMWLTKVKAELAATAFYQDLLHFHNNEIIINYDTPDTEANSKLYSVLAGSLHDDLLLTISNCDITTGTGILKFIDNKHSRIAGNSAREGSIVQDFYSISWNPPKKIFPPSINDSNPFTSKSVARTTASPSPQLATYGLKPCPPNSLP